MAPKSLKSFIADNESSPNKTKSIKKRIFFSPNDDT